MAAATIGVKIDQATKDRLGALAEAKKRTPHWLMKEAIKEYLTREERRERERLEDAERWDRYTRTGEAIPHPAVRDWLNALAAGRDATCPTS